MRPKWAVLRSMFLLISYPIGRHIWLKAQGLKVLNELRSPVIDLREWKTVSFALQIQSVHSWLLVFTPLQQFALVWLERFDRIPFLRG